MHIFYKVMAQNSKVYHTYNVTFVYRQKTYNCSFQSTTELSELTDKNVVWDCADTAIKECMKNIPNKVEGIYPHTIVVQGEFGSIKVKD